MHQRGFHRRFQNKGIIIMVSQYYFKFVYRESRLAAMRQTSMRRTLTKQQYLYQKGWLSHPLPHYQQPWVMSAMREFHKKQNQWENRICTTCHEVWPARTGDSATCTRCKRDTNEVKRYSRDNDMWPGEVPECLRDLTQIEEMLIARACPIMSVYRKHGGQRGYKGHVLNLPQDIQGIL